MAQLILYLIIGFILFEFVLSKTLSWLNLKTWDKPMPDEVKDLYDKEKYQKAKEYAVTNYNVGTVTSVIMLTITITFLVLHGFAWVDGIVRSISPSPILQSLLFFGILGGASFIIELPFEIYSTFVVEQKYGFNKTTPALFVGDKIKGALLAIVVGGGILALLTWLFSVLGNKFWIAAWVVISGFSIFIAAFYTSILLPIFNKLTPLEGGELRSAIEKYSAGVQFPLTNIFIMGGSKKKHQSQCIFQRIGRQKEYCAV